MKFKLKYYFKKVINFIYADYYDFKCFHGSLYIKNINFVCYNILDIF